MLKASSSAQASFPGHPKHRQGPSAYPPFLTDSYRKTENCGMCQGSRKHDREPDDLKAGPSIFSRPQQINVNVYLKLLKPVQKHIGAKISLPTSTLPTRAATDHRTRRTLNASR